MNNIKNLVTHKKEISFDNESFEILENVSPVYRNAIINMGIKLVSQTDFFKNYMEHNGLANVEIKENITTTSINTTVIPTVAVQEQIKYDDKVTPAATSWDDF